MRTVRLRTPLIPLSVCAALMLAACGDDTVSSPGDSSLAAPVVVSVVSGGGQDSASGEVPAAAESSTLDERDMGLLPAFGGYVFEVGDGLPALPTSSTGYHFPVGATVDAAEVARIAAALGVAGEPQAVDPATGNLWQVGPNDGSAPALFVGNDGQLSWYYSAPWATVGGGCVAVGSDGDETDAADVDTSVPVPIDECATPPPPANVPTAEQAEATAAELLTVLGEDAAAWQFETFADEWSASVTAYTTTVDGLRWPVGYGFGFGAEGALQWANGTFAEPVATGPYPLIDLDGALARLGEQNGMWGYGGGAIAIDTRAAEEAAASPPVDDQSTPPPDEGVTETPEPVVATLVDVKADLWWVWDADNSVWLLPAYTFTDVEGTQFTVPAVTDEYMIVVEPTIEPVPEPAPVEPVDPVVVDPPSTDVVDPAAPTGQPADLEALVGTPLKEFEELATRYGYTTRVARIDGVDQALTMDYVETRVNVAVEGDVVVEIVSIG